MVEDCVLLGAVAIMRAFAAARPDLSNVLRNSAPHLFTYAGAAMWLVAKACGMRTGALGVCGWVLAVGAGHCM